MRRAPSIKSKELEYTRLQGLAWIANRAIRPSLVHGTTGALLGELFSQSELPLVINCRGISGIHDHAFDGVRKLIEGGKRTVIFTHARGIVNQLAEQLGDPLLVHKNDATVYGAGDLTPGDVARMQESSEKVEAEWITAKVAGVYRSTAVKRMDSTPLLANGVFDARQLVADPETFMWIALRMADELRNRLESLPVDGAEGVHTLRPLKILAVSLRGSPFAGALGILTGLDYTIEIVDHVGPKHRILEGPSLVPTGYKGDYVLVGDFIVGGTELRVASAYADHRGGRLRQAIFVGAALDPSEYQGDIEIARVVDLFEARSDYRITFTRVTAS